MLVTKCLLTKVYFSLIYVVTFPEDLVYSVMGSYEMVSPHRDTSNPAELSAVTL